MPAVYFLLRRWGDAGAWAAAAFLASFIFRGVPPRAADEPLSQTLVISIVSGAVAAGAVAILSIWK